MLYDITTTPKEGVKQLRSYALVWLMYNKHLKTVCEAKKVIYVGCVIYDKPPKTSCQAAKVLNFFHYEYTDTKNNNI